MLRSAFVADATQAVHATLELDDVVQAVVEESSRLVGAGSASLRLADDEGDLRPVAAQIDIAGREPGEPAEPSDDLLRMVGHTKEPALLNSGTVSVLCVPLVRRERLIGLITLGAGASDRFTDDDAALLGRFAVPAAAAIEHAQRYEAAVFLLDRDTEDAA
jgi:GAF domain-containing protein